MRFDIDRRGNTSEAIIRAVSELSGQDPMEMAPLGESYDADAIDSLFSSSSDHDQLQLQLDYEGYRVRIESGSVHLKELSDAGFAE